MTRLLVLLTVLSLFGCGPTYDRQRTSYDHPTKTMADFNHDQSDCLQIATQNANQTGMAGNIVWINDQMRQCLQMKYGWTAQTIPD